MAKENPLYTYETVVLDLTDARTGVRYQFSGNFIKAIESSDIDANIDIAFNSSGNDTVNIKKGRAIRAHVLEWYITNTAQPGKTITLLIATEDSLRIFDDGVVADIDTIQEIIKPVGIYYDVNDLLAEYAGYTIPLLDYYGAPGVGAHQTVYTVPAGKTLYLQTISGSMRSGINALAHIYEYTGAISTQALLTFASNGANATNFVPMLKINSDQLITVVPEGTATTLLVTGQGYLV